MAASGVTSAHLAKAGYTGPSLAYEGTMGFYNVFLGALKGQGEPLMVQAQLGERWEFPKASIKLYPACHHMHAFVNAAREIRDQLEGELRVEDVQSVHTLVAGVAIPLVCEPPQEKWAPATDYIAQFSLQYSVACGLLRGVFGLGELAPEVRGDPAVTALARKVTFEVDPNSGFPKSRTGEVILRMKDGRVLRVRNEILPEEPASDAEIVEKFMENARMAVTPARARELCDLVLGLEGERDAAVVLQALSQSNARQGQAA
jgi:2-methylcitrate dehydratase PrpD